MRSDSPQLGTRFDTEKLQETPVLGRKLTSLPLLNSAVRPARGTGDLFLNNTLFVTTAAAGAINLVTRSGTNVARGDVVAVSRPGGWQADAPVTRQKSRDELKQGNAFFSGPLVRDKVYWSLAGESIQARSDSASPEIERGRPGPSLRPWPGRSGA